MNQLKEQIKKEQALYQSLYEKNAIIEQLMGRIEELEKQLQSDENKEE